MHPTRGDRAASLKRSFWCVVDGFVVDATATVDRRIPAGSQLMSTDDAGIGAGPDAFGFSFSRGRNAHFPDTGRRFADGVQRYLRDGHATKIKFPPHGTLVILGRLDEVVDDSLYYAPRARFLPPVAQSSSSRPRRAAAARRDVRRPQDAPPAVGGIPAQSRRLAGLVDERREEVVGDAPPDPAMSSAALPRLAHVVPHDVRGQRRLVVPRPINELREALVLVGAVEVFVLVGVLGLGVLRRARRRHAVRLRGLARRVRLLLEVERLDGRFRWRSVGASSLREAPPARARAPRRLLRPSSWRVMRARRALVDAGAAQRGHGSEEVGSCPMVLEMDPQAIQRCASDEMPGRLSVRCCGLAPQIDLFARGAGFVLLVSYRPLALLQRAHASIEVRRGSSDATPRGVSLYTSQSCAIATRCAIAAPRTCTRESICASLKLKFDADAVSAPATSKKKRWASAAANSSTPTRQKLQVQRLGELVDREPEDALLLSDLPAQYQAAFDQPLRTREQTPEISRRFRWLRAL